MARQRKFVLTKIDEILAWEQRKEAERDTRFIELARYLCEVRAGQHWRMEKLKSFDEFLERRFPNQGGRRIADIHPRAPATTGQAGTEGIGMDEGIGAGESGALGGAGN